MKTIIKQLGILSVLCAMAITLQGCLGSDSESDFGILSTSEGTFQGTVTTNKVDILWVIDNSGSMLTKQQNLANSFESFMDTFSDLDFNFNIGIITSDVSVTGQDGDFQGTPTVIDNDTVNFISTFQTNVVVGATGASDARILDAIKLALSDSKLANENTGFIREDAHLAVIILSDANDDDSSATVAEIDALLEVLKPTVTDPNTGRDKKQYSVSAVVADDGGEANFACPNLGDPFDNGTLFIELAGLSDGTIADICASDFSDGLLNLSKGIAELITEIFLSSEPDTSTLVVTFNGVEQPEDATNGWTYESADNKIVFHGTSIPGDNILIAINYTPADIIR